MGNSSKAKEKVTVDVVLDKMCYYPGEIIRGNIEIKPKTYLNDSILGGALVILKFNQTQEYSYTTGSDDNETTTYVIEDEDLFKQYIDYRYFKGANILLGINIPFQIKIPLKIQPTVYIKTFYISHHIYCEIPWIRCNKRFYLIIKDHHFFTADNQLLKMPANYTAEFYKDNNIANGKLIFSLIMPKNSYTYYETIPFELYLSSQNSMGQIDNITISINKSIYLNNKSNHEKHFQTVSNETLVSYVDYPKGDLNKYIIKGNLQIPHNEKFYDICPKETYINAENTKINKVNNLTPFCLGGLISVEIIYKVEVKYKGKNPYIFQFPIEFLSDDIEPLD